MYDYLQPGLTRTSAGAVVANACDFIGAHLTSDGVHACTVTLYDNASAGSGTVLATLEVGTSGSDDFKLPANTVFRCQNGIYANVDSGTLGRIYVFSGG